MKLKGKIALIPGAARPIGREIAKKFGDQGATLILPVFDWRDSITELEEEFTEIGYDFSVIAADLRLKLEVVRLAEYIKSHARGIDYLINNIERGGMPVVHGSYDHPHNQNQWDLEFDTTVKAKWQLFHHLYPLMQNSEGGSVVNISSIAAVTGRCGPAALFFNDGYSAANRAIRSFTENWARQAAPTIRVNELVLGLIQNRHGEGTRGWSCLSEAEKISIKDQIPLGRTGLAKEVAETVYFLAVEASYITGSTLTIDGGYTLGPHKVPPLPEGFL